jgi:hypothetical protein
MRCGLGIDSKKQKSYELSHTNAQNSNNGSRDGRHAAFLALLDSRRELWKQLSFTSCRHLREAGTVHHGG